jgi:catechol 2,3-dioxygenase-like lactoylglutathione lyase family enzyme
MKSSISEQINFYPCLDIEATHHFYTTVLQLRLTLDQGKCRIYKTTETSFLGFCTQEKFTVSKGAIITIVTDDVDSWAIDILKRGWKLEVAPRVNEQFRIYQCFLCDPDGHVIEIQKFIDPFP